MAKFFVSLMILGLGIAAAYWVLYLGPRTRAIQTGQRSVRLWGGIATLVLWEPGESYVFLKNKRLHDVGDPEGGMRTILAAQGMEAIGPFSLRTELMTWEHDSVLTREAMPVGIKLGVWWRVTNPRTYVFRISEELHHEFNKLRVGIHESAVRWLQVLTESAVRSHINQLGIAEIISTQATGFLQIDQRASSPSDSSSRVGFEGLVEAICQEVSCEVKEYGIEIQKLEVQEITLPHRIQEAINETREAFLLPIRSEKEAEARKIALRGAADVLGVDTVGLNELLKNFQGASFSYWPQFIQSLFEMVGSKAAGIASKEKSPMQIPSDRKPKELPGALPPRDAS